MMMLGWWLVVVVVVVVMKETTSFPWVTDFFVSLYPFCPPGPRWQAPLIEK
jgi:hypothetical protein